MPKPESKPKEPLSEEEIAAMLEQEALCAACDNPCDVEIKDYPANFVDKITTDEPLLGSTKAHKWHVLLCSGVSAKKWPAHLESVEDSFHAHVNSVLGNIREQLPEKVVLSSIPMASEDGVDPEFECDIVIFPEGVKYKAVQREQVEDLLLAHMLQNYASSPSSTLVGLPEPQALEQKTWVLICGHKLRDNRCGIVAPILQDAFEKVLEAKGLEDKVYVDAISHIGGHKFAGNVIVHTGNPALGAIWYGRVFPRHVNAIVEKTIENNTVLEPLLRYRSTSW